VYYDLVTSLPHLPYFERAPRLPISRLRLDQRLRLLRAAHAEQLARAQPLAGWRPDRLRWKSEAEMFQGYNGLMASRLEPSLREYVAFRMDQRTLVAALRRKREGLPAPDRATPWGIGSWVRPVTMHWDDPDFGPAHAVPWLAEARDLLAVGEARGLERLLMDVAWRWLDRCAQEDMFSFEAVFCYVFKWDILQARLAWDADKAKTRFRDLIDRVTHVERN
jgi:hypothetical protein